MRANERLVGDGTIRWVMLTEGSPVGVSVFMASNGQLAVDAVDVVVVVVVMLSIAVVVVRVPGAIGAPSAFVYFSIPIFVGGTIDLFKGRHRFHRLFQGQLQQCDRAFARPRRAETLLEVFRVLPSAGASLPVRLRRRSDHALQDVPTPSESDQTPLHSLPPASEGPIHFPPASPDLRVLCLRWRRHRDDRDDIVARSAGFGLLPVRDAGCRQRRGRRERKEEDSGARRWSRLPCVSGKKTNRRRGYGQLIQSMF
jgi:hypothetical protein